MSDAEMIVVWLEWMRARWASVVSVDPVKFSLDFVISVRDVPVVVVVHVDPGGVVDAVPALEVEGRELGYGKDAVWGALGMMAEDAAASAALQGEGVVELSVDRSVRGGFVDDI